MANEKAGGYISKLTFNNGQKLDIADNDIVIFVGPNNAGKSQSLKDIYALSKDKVPSVVISEITITKTTAPVSQLLSEIAEGSNQGSYTSYDILGHSVNIWSYTDNNFLQNTHYGSFRELFVANLDTSARLTICNPPSSIRRDGAKEHPIHYAAFDSKYRKWISDSFKKAFGIHSRSLI